jgi:hypothetical protein
MKHKKKKEKKKEKKRKRSEEIIITYLLPYFCTCCIVRLPSGARASFPACRNRVLFN